MSDWFQTHSFIANFLSTFQYVISSEGDHELKEQYYRYVTWCVRHSFFYLIKWTADVLPCVPPV